MENSRIEKRFELKVHNVGGGGNTPVDDVATLSVLNREKY